jgi:hypothetical protein
MKKLRQRLTLADVNQAINSLKEQNINPTADNILTEIIRSSNGTVGGSKGTVLKLKRQLGSTDNRIDLSTVKNTSTVQYSTNKRPYGTESVSFSVDEKVLSTLEVQLWERLEARLDDKLREQLGIHQVNEHPLDEALQKMYELWLDSVARYIATQAQLEALQQLVQTKDEEIKEMARLQLTLNQAANQIEAQQTQLNQLNQDLNSLHKLWLEAVSQIATPSAAASVMTETNPLETYFQILTQLHHLTPAQKYDYAMKLFERGMGPSEVSRILAVNKGSLQHYKDGKRKRPNNG